MGFLMPVAALYIGFLDGVKEFTTKGKIKAVNSWINQQASYASDALAKHVSDYWSSTGEFLHDRRGDCEDYALAKFTALVALGVSDVRVEIVKKWGRPTSHMICVAEGYVLDDPEQNTIGALLPYDRKDYMTAEAFSMDACCVSSEHYPKWVNWKTRNKPMLRRWI
jgi:hypothetical protein